MRYLADSNRRPRFCRPIPNHSGKVPFAAAKIRKKPNIATNLLKK